MGASLASERSSLFFCPFCDFLAFRPYLVTPLSYNRQVMPSNRRTARFSFFDLSSALWYFLGPERRSFLVFGGILLTVLCYTMVPPYIAGAAASFLIGYLKADSAARPSISPLFWLTGLLSGCY